MTPTIILDFLGLISSKKVDSNSSFLYIFKSLRILYDVPVTKNIKLNKICGKNNNHFD